MTTVTITAPGSTAIHFPDGQVGHLTSCDPNYAIQIMAAALQNLPYTAGFEPRSIRQEDVDKLTKMSRSELLVVLQEGLQLLSEADEAITAYYKLRKPEDYTS